MCALLALTVVTTAAATADDAQLVEAGRSAGRAVLIFRDPWACAVALIRTRCQADVTRFFAGHGDGDFKQIPNIGPHPVSGLRAFLERGDRDGVDRSLSYLDTVFAPQTLWTGDAHAATLFDVGALQIAVPAADGNLARLMLALGPAIDLRKHAGSVSGGDLQSDITPFAPASATPSSSVPADITTRVTTLVDASLRQFEPPPLPLAAPAQSPLGYARFGLAAAWIAQFIDNPAWLEQSDILALADTWIAQSTALAPAAGDAARQFRAALRERPYDHGRTLQAAQSLLRGVMGGGSQERARQIVVAMESAQLTYNAAVLRDPAMARVILGTLPKIGELDTALPDFAVLRATAAAIRPDDWEAQFKLGNAIVADISATATAPAPASAPTASAAP